MDQKSIDFVLKDYHELVKRVDSHICRTQNKFSGKIACKRGCDKCCRCLTLFPVEAFALSAAFIRLPLKLRNKIAQKIKKKEETCPLLIDRACVLYPERPIICRTHGYPIHMEKEGKRQIDFCPENFKGVTSFPKEVLLDIEKLNTALVFVNHGFTGSIETDAPLPERIPVSEALFILVGKE